MPRPESRGAAAILFTYLVALDAVFALEAYHYVRGARGLAVALAWAGARLVATACVAWLLVCQERAIALATFVLTASCFCVDLALRGINDVGLTPATVRLAASEGGSYGGAALRVFGGAACVWALLGLGLMHVLWILVHDVLPVRAAQPARPAAVLVASAVLSLLAPAPGWLPVFLGPVLAVADVALHPVPDLPRSPVVTPPSALPRAKQIVVLVDESVRGDLLSIARPETHTTPWLEAHRASFVDLGVASSTTNCSGTAHAALLTGATPADLPDPRGELRRRPTLFDAAARAGLRTVLVDAQAAAKAPTLSLTADDLARLSSIRVVRAERPALLPADRDRALAEMVAAETAGAPSFVYAIKRGAHYPYDEAVPPTRARRAAADAVALGFRPEEAASAARYLDAVSFAVDDFLADLLPRLADRDILVFYTSDHAESLLEDGRARAHCGEGRAPPEQGRVPLLVWANGGAAATLSEIVAPRGHVSAYRLHPTLLRMMGYAPSTPTFFDAGEDELRFYSGDAVGRSSAWWNPIGQGDPSLSTMRYR